MSDIVDLKGLNTPDQAAPMKTSFDVRPRIIEKWIVNLPMANLGETSKLVFRAVVEINRLELSIQQRYKTLELLRKPCQYVVEALEKHFAGHPLPLNTRNRKISELTRAILSELAVGYKVIAQQIESSARPDLKLLTATLHRAVNYEGQLLMRSYQIYAPFPRGIWKELNTMYHFAESYELLEQEIKDPLNKVNNYSTISTIYRKILLLSLAMPYRLHRGEIDKVCALLDRFVYLSRIDNVSPQHNPTALFIIDLHKDNPPGYLAMHKEDDYRSCRLLNTSEMVISINDQYQSANPDLMNLISSDLLDRLLSTWSVMAKRGFSRIKKESAYAEVALGLSAAHHFVSGEQPFTPIPSTDDLQFTSSTADYHSTKVAALSDVVKGPDVWNMNYTYSDNDPTNAGSPTTSLNAGVTDLQGYEYQTIKLSIANVSAGGYCLVSDSDVDFTAHVGDLLAIRDVEDASIDQWGIGVIRRMLSNRVGNFELGVQMLTPNSVAVAARLDAGNGSEPSSDFLRCLMLPELRAIDQPATIITPAMPFRTGSQIRINLHDKSIIAVLTEQLEYTNSFSQFQFDVVDENVQGSGTGHDEQTTEMLSEEEFDSIWTTL